MVQMMKSLLKMMIIVTFLLLSVADLTGWRLKTVSLTCPAMPVRGVERYWRRRGMLSQMSSSTGRGSQHWVSESYLTFHQVRGGLGIYQLIHPAKHEDTLD